MNALRQFLILLLSIFLSVVLFYLIAVFPAIIQLQQGNTNPPPPFDVGHNYIYFSNIKYQLPLTILILLVPVFGSLMAYLLNGNKRNLTVFIPAILGYFLYLVWFILLSLI